MPFFSLGAVSFFYPSGGMAFSLLPGSAWSEHLILVSCPPSFARPPPPQSRPGPSLLSKISRVLPVSWLTKFLCPVLYLSRPPRAFLPFWRPPPPFVLTAHVRFVVWVYRFPVVFFSASPRVGPEPSIFSQFPF